MKNEEETKMLNEKRIEELAELLNNVYKAGTDESIVEMEQEYMELTGEDEIRYPIQY